MDRPDETLLALPWMREISGTATHACSASFQRLRKERFIAAFTDQNRREGYKKQHILLTNTDNVVCKDGSTGWFLWNAAFAHRERQHEARPTATKPRADRAWEARSPFDLAATAAPAVCEPLLEWWPFRKKRGGPLFVEIGSEFDGIRRRKGSASRLAEKIEPPDWAQPLRGRLIRWHRSQPVVTP